jgi:hypothetical protein
MNKLKSPKSQKSQSAAAPSKNKAVEAAVASEIARVKDEIAARVAKRLARKHSFVTPRYLPTHNSSFEHLAGP